MIAKIKKNIIEFSEFIIEVITDLSSDVANFIIEDIFPNIIKIISILATAIGVYKFIYPPLSKELQPYLTFFIPLLNKISNFIFQARTFWGDGPFLSAIYIYILVIICVIIGYMYSRKLVKPMGNFIYYILILLSAIVCILWTILFFSEVSYMDLAIYSICLLLVFVSVSAVLDAIYSEHIELEANLEARYDRANGLLEMGKFDDAIKIFDVLIEIPPKNIKAWYQAKAWFGKGNIYRYQGKYEEAVHAYDRAIAIGYTLAWHEKDIVLKLLGRTTKADEAFAKANELEHKG
jgi:tetratricopeptide (TPR) repeat protein